MWNSCSHVDDVFVCTDTDSRVSRRCGSHVIPESVNQVRGCFGCTTADVASSFDCFDIIRVLAY